MGGNRKPKPVFGKLQTGRSSGNGKPERTTKSESSEDDSDDGNDGGKWKEEARETFITVAAAREAFLQKQVTSLKQELVMEKLNSASSLSSGSNASKCVVALKLTDVHRSQMKLFRDTHGWSRIKFIPNADFYVRNPTTLTALFKCLLIETEEDKVKYSEDLQREYSDETNRKRHNVKNAVRSKYKSE